MAHFCADNYDLLTGATPFSYGEVPLVSESDDCVLVVHREGAEVLQIDEDCVVFCRRVHLKTSWTLFEATAFIQNLPTNWSDFDMKMFGFQNKA